MSRTISSATQTEIAKRAIEPILLLSIEFDSGTVYLTDAYKDLVYDGNTYQASGNILSISGVSEELAQRVTGIQINLSGVNQANIFVALTEDYLNRNVYLHRGFLDSNGRLVIDPFNIFRGWLDDFTLTESKDSATLSWAVSSEWADFERVGGRRANHIEQQVFFSGDLGFEFIDQIVKDIRWGRV